MIFTEGACFATVTLYLPADVTDMHSRRTPRDVVVLYQRAAAGASAPPLVARALTGGATPRTVAVVGLCGCGETQGSLGGG